jgi:hypothetical protein
MRISRSRTMRTRKTEAVLHLHLLTPINNNNSNRPPYNTTLPTSSSSKQTVHQSSLFTSKVKLDPWCEDDCNTVQTVQPNEGFNQDKHLIHHHQCSSNALEDYIMDSTQGEQQRDGIVVDLHEAYTHESTKELATKARSLSARIRASIEESRRPRDKLSR